MYCTHCGTIKLKTNIVEKGYVTCSQCRNEAYEKYLVNYYDGFLTPCRGCGGIIAFDVKLARETETCNKCASGDWPKKVKLASSPSAPKKKTILDRIRRVALKDYKYPGLDSNE
jgi:hypothetical protein